MQLTRLRPASPVAEHNLAAALGDAGFALEADQAATRAIAKGGTAAATWLVKARALTALGYLDEAALAFDRSLQTGPDEAGVLRERAQLEWMRSRDPAALRSVVERLRERAAGDPSAAVHLCECLRAVADASAALDALAPWLVREDCPDAVLLAGFGAAIDVDAPLALRLSHRVWERGRSRDQAAVAHAYALLGADCPQEALPILDDHLARFPEDRAAQGAREAVLRVCGDARALSATDYAATVRIVRLRPDLEAGDRTRWLDRLSGALRALHPFSAPPFGQSIRGGVQSRIDPRMTDDADIHAVFDGLEATLASYAESLRPRKDRAGRARLEISGAWSVRLSTGGRHVDHVHPGCRVSAVAYVDLPPAVASGSRQGWLRFGAAPTGAGRTLPPLHWVEPRRGDLVLFPSWFWHGTEPFEGAGDRLTLAFNVSERQGG
ncbi:hypothetical protein CD943_04525 [Brevundimonas diminuta]|uniref:Uncharacterized protein n=2 Tax=Brevundimonas diminuta TaxID=293 RepID=A0A1Z3LW43_BREDI|nr:hypothetical protein CD943_04525 [Brevundimonas diminuta]